MFPFETTVKIPSDHTTDKDLGLEPKLEALLWALLRTTSDGVIAINQRQKIVMFNGGAELLFGYLAREVIGKPLEFLIPEGSADRHRVLVEEFGRGKKEAHLMRGRPEVLGLKKDGTIFHAEASITRVSTSRKKYMVAIVRDITERKRIEHLLQTQVKHLATMRQIDLAVASSLDLNHTLNVIIEQVQQHLGGDAICVCTCDAETSHLRFAAHTGFHNQDLASVDLELGQGLMGRAAWEQRTVAVADFADGADTSQLATCLAGEHFVSGYASPLMAKGRMLGVVGVFYRTRFIADEPWISFFEGICDPIAIALDDALLFGEARRSNEALKVAYQATIEGWSRALDLRDHETEGHSLRVTELTVRLAESMGLSSEELVHVRRGGLLHDIGKLGVPDRILLKPGPLDAGELETMRKHPELARDLLEPIEYLAPALDIPYHHHEKWDGSGYPAGLKGEAIPLAARIFAIVDVWDALTHKRPYRDEAWAPERVRAYLSSQRGSHFDPDVVDAFLALEVDLTT